MLFTIMGAGCKSVRVVPEDESDLLIGRWADGRIGTVRGIRFAGGTFAAAAYTSEGIVHAQMAASRQATRCCSKS